MITGGGNGASILHQVNKATAASVAVVAGVTNTVNLLTDGWVGDAQNNPFTDNVKFAFARLVGPNIAFQILSGGTGKVVLTSGTITSPAGLPPMSLKPLGFINKSTGVGIAALVVDFGVEEFLGNKYGAEWIHPWLRFLGIAFLASGIFGGLFDPPTAGIRAGGTGLFAPSSSIAFRGAASGRRSTTPFAPSGGY